MHALAPGRAATPTLAFATFSSERNVNTCSNISKTGSHLIVCEDKVGGTNFLRGVTPKGEVYTLARNAHLGDGDVGGTSEFAGCCFSPDGTTLFVNVYSPGLTLAITGPWSQFRDA